MKQRGTIAETEGVTLQSGPVSCPDLKNLRTRHAQEVTLSSDHQMAHETPTCSPGW